ncbi:MAG UNVERIFIED_CONTAM: GNAT family N-acetyltransferase [Rickettsiaceae bacterium]|jgi:ribosomal protein S18 acetylase RimI-like enzyme
MINGDPVRTGKSFTGVLRPIPLAEMEEVWQLDLRCFVDGEAYDSKPSGIFYPILMPLLARSVPMMVQWLHCIVALIELDGVGHITAIAVAPEYRRHGLARILLGYIEETFRTRGIKTIRLEVRVENLPAISLYEQLGYAVVQRLHGYYSSGGDGYLMVESDLIRVGSTLNSAGRRGENALSHRLAQ